MFDDTGDLLVFLVVLLLRLVVPLFIPRYPLPGIIAALILDGIDQTIFQKFTSLDTDGPYQSYDKALDIYYLTIAYLSTMRNWNNLTAFEVSRFLLYYRLVGVVLYEFTHWRPILLIFPNTFEYFFIFYEVVRLRWDTRRMSPKVVYGAAAAIWIVIKLPQEYWIHVAQNDMTDTLRKYPALVPIIAVVLVAILGAAWWVVKHKCPPADWRPSFADPLTQTGGDMSYSKTNLRLFAGRGFDRSLLEKIVLISLICIIFSQILPRSDVGNLQLTLGVAAVIIGNMLVSAALERRQVTWRSIFRQFAAMLVVNGALALAFIIIVPSRNGSLSRGDLLFFLFLLTLMVLMYDAYRPHYRKRLAESNLRVVD
jgi:hypothetical protein